MATINVLKNKLPDTGDPETVQHFCFLSAPYEKYGQTVWQVAEREDQARKHCGTPISMMQYIGDHAKLVYK